MIKIEPVVIVEGKYDKIKLESILDTLIIETDGFAIFKDKKKMKLIRKLADKHGILILTDSDSAGFKIRSFIGGNVPQDKVIHAYIPDILGKEKRKSEPSKEGKLGVEGISSKVILTALKRAGVTAYEADESHDEITNFDLFEDGISGGKNSKKYRKKLLKQLDLPERISTHSLLKVLNMTMTHEEYKKVLEECKK